MAFSIVSGQWGSDYPRKVASTEFTVGMLVAQLAAGTITPATALSTEVYGICQATVDASDTTNDRIMVSVPQDRNSIFRGPCTTGTIALNDEGDTFDLTDANGFDGTASTLDIVRVHQYLSDTTALLTLNKPTIV